MKKVTNIASPFIMLLIPVFLLVGVLALNIDKEIPSQHQAASIKLQVPAFTTLIQTVLK